MTPKELREKSPKERDELTTELTSELFNLKIKKATGQLEKNHRIGQVKRDLARLATIQRETKIE